MEGHFLRPKTEEAFKTLLKLIPGGVDSPARAFGAVGTLPLMIKRAKGAHLEDLDGHRYIDYCASWGALIAGHAHPLILEEIIAAASRGTTYGQSTEVEGMLAQEVMKRMPSIERIRFVSSGTEATMSAIRLARGYTGRAKIVTFIGGYHGHADCFLARAGSSLFAQGSFSKGVPESAVSETLTLPYNDAEKVKECFAVHGDQIAALIIEPIAGNMGVVSPDPGFLTLLRSLTKKHAALLVFDEVITGFRVDLGGAQRLFGITPDLTCLGKIVGGGLPAAAFGGREEIMAHLAPLGSVFQAGTLSGNPLAMHAGLAALSLLDSTAYQRLEESSAFFADAITVLLKKQGIPGCVQRVGSMLTLFFGKERVRDHNDVESSDRQRFATFFRALLARKVFIPPSPFETWFVSLSHTRELLEESVAAIDHALECIGMS